MGTTDRYYPSDNCCNYYKLVFYECDNWNIRISSNSAKRCICLNKFD